VYKRQALALEGRERVLEVGAGTGYQAAVLSLLAREVIAVETIPSLTESARERLTRLGYSNVRVEQGDGSEGLAGEAPFDAILVSAAAPAVPQPLIDQLAAVSYTHLPGAAQNYGATALLSEAISSGVGGRIEHLFGISSFRVDPFIAGTATEANAAARVTIQQQVTRDLAITYSTNAATSNQYQLIQVEYTVKRGLSIIFLRDINGTYGMDVKFVKHFK